MYPIWLGSLSIHCGWDVESETSRLWIPSTSNWTIIGVVNWLIKVYPVIDYCPFFRSQVGNVAEIINNVRHRGMFKTRKPEGKAAGH